MTAGYSKKSLVEKLGIKDGATVSIINSPDNYKKTLGLLPSRVKKSSKLQTNSDFIQFFTRSKEELKSKFPILKKSLTKNGILWISWPKGVSRIVTDLNENIVREIGLENGLVDIKVCAVDEIWSGLKFVFRIKDRAK